MTRIQLNSRSSEKLFTLVDDEDAKFAASFKWSASRTRNNVYAACKQKVDGKPTSIYLHRLLLGITDPNVEVDHVNRDGLDNRRANLRPCTLLENRGNSAGHVSRKARFKGVFFEDFVKGRPWRARVAHGGKVVFEQNFYTDVDAAIAYDAVAKRYYRHFAYLNFPEMG